MNNQNTSTTQAETYSHSDYMKELGLTLEGIVTEDRVQKVTGNGKGQKKWGAVEGLLDSGGIDECAVIGIVGSGNGYMLHTPIESYHPDEFLNEELDPFIAAVQEDYGNDLEDLEAFACGTNLDKPNYWSDDHQEINSISKIWATRGLIIERLEDTFGSLEHEWERNSDYNTRLTINPENGTFNYDKEYNPKV